MNINPAEIRKTKIEQKPATAKLQDNQTNIHKSLQNNSPPEGESTPADTKEYLIDLASASYTDTITVHAPHPPSAQPSLVPLSPTVRERCRQRKPTCSQKPHKPKDSNGNFCHLISDPNFVLLRNPFYHL